MLSIDMISQLKAQIRQVIWQEKVQNAIKFSHEEPVIRCLEKLLVAMISVN